MRLLALLLFLPTFAFGGTISPTVAEGFQWTLSFDPATDPVVTAVFTPEFNSSNQLSTGEGFTVSLYDDAGNPVTSASYAHTGTILVEGCNCVTFTSPAIDQTLYARIEMDSGTAFIDALNVNVYGSVNAYAGAGATWTGDIPTDPEDPPPLPEPSPTSVAVSSVTSDYAQVDFILPTLPTMPTTFDVTLTSDPASFLSADDEVVITVYDQFGRMVGNHVSGKLSVDYPTTYTVGISIDNLTTKYVMVRVGMDKVQQGFYLAGATLSTALDSNLTGSMFDYDQSDWASIRPPLNYVPDYPTLGEYSVEGIGDAIHTATSPSVTLAPGQTINSAVQQLKDLSPTGGVVVIPYTVEPIACDVFNGNNASRYLPALTFRGTVGPAGQQPRFYCRTYKPTSNRYDGHMLTAPSNAFFFGSVDTNSDGIADPWNVVMENIIIDGYGTGVTVPNTGKFVMRNSWVHHATGDGITATGIDTDTVLDFNQDSIMEFAGSEFSHSGQGNASHCFYIHRGNGGNAIFQVKMVDSFVHSCNYSSGLKSIAEENYVGYSKFAKSYDSDWSFQRRYTQVQVDFVSCTESIIEYSDFVSNRPETDVTPGNATIDFAARAGIYGCDYPYPGGWYDDVFSADPIRPLGWKLDPSTGGSQNYTFESPYITKESGLPYELVEVVWYGSNEVFTPAGAGDVPRALDPCEAADDTLVDPALDCVMSRDVNNQAVNMNNSDMFGYNDWVEIYRSSTGAGNAQVTAWAWDDASHRSGTFTIDWSQVTSSIVMVVLEDKYQGKYDCRDDPQADVRCKLDYAPYSSDYWVESYWTGLAGAITLPSYVRNNTITSTGTNFDSQDFVRSGGTYPWSRPGFSGCGQMLPQPTNWYERHRVYVSDNYIDGPNLETAFEISAALMADYQIWPSLAAPNDPDEVVIGPGYTTYGGAAESCGYLWPQPDKHVPKLFIFTDNLFTNP